MSSEMIWCVCLCCLMLGVYHLGKTSAPEAQLDPEARLELEKYKWDKYYEHQRWREERGIEHGNENA